MLSSKLPTPCAPQHSPKSNAPMQQQPRSLGCRLPCAAAPAPTCSHEPAHPSPALLQKARLFGLVGTAFQNAKGSTMLPAPTSPKELRAQMASAGRSCMAVVLPFASSVITGGGGENSMGEVYFALSKAIDIYMMVLTVRVLMTWFRQINWMSEPARTLRQFTDPPLNACRGIIPPIGGIDLSPMLLFFGLSFLSKQLKMLAIGA